MRTLLRERSSEITESTRSPGPTTYSLRIIDPTDGSELATPTVSLDSASVTLDTVAYRGDTELSFSGSVGIGKWWLVSSEGPAQVIDIVRANGNIAHLRSPVLDTYAVGSALVGYWLRATYTPGADDPDSVLLEWTVDDDVYTDEAVIVRRRLRPPLTGEELLELYPRLRDLASPDQGNDQGQAWVDQAWSALYATVWQSGRILDHIRSPEMVRGAFLAQVGLLLSMQGIDPIGMGDAIEYQREAERRLNREISRLVRSNVWIDADDDMTQDSGEDYAVGLRLKW